MSDIKIPSITTPQTTLRDGVNSKQNDASKASTTSSNVSSQQASYVSNSIEQRIERLAQEPAPKIDQAKVDRIQAAIDNGEYKIDTSTLADKLMSEFN
jgi:flagellar biosynthesis anti-sigma factor FlgM